MSFQGAQRFTVNYGIIQIGLLVTVHGTLPLIAYLVFPSHFVVSFIIIRMLGNMWVGLVQP